MLKTTAIVLGSLLFAAVAAAQVPRYITGTIEKGELALVIPPIKNNFVVVSAPRSQWIVEPRCEHGACRGWFQLDNCEGDRLNSAALALTISPGSRLGQLVRYSIQERPLLGERWKRRIPLEDEQSRLWTRQVSDNF